MLAGNLSNVLFPVLAHLRSEPVRQRQAALTASRALAYVVMPYCFLQAAVAGPLLTLVFGAKWQAAIPLVEILSIGLAFDAVSWVAGALLQARGEFRRSFLYSCIFAPLFFAMVGLGAVSYSGLGAAVAVSFFYAAFSPIYSYRVFRRMGVLLGEVATIYIGPVSFAAIAVVAALALDSLIPSGNLVKTLVIGTAGSLFYLALVRLLAPSAFHQLLTRFRSMAQGRMRRVAVAGQA
jgi:PST family polysaccharide transporter